MKQKRQSVMLESIVLGENVRLKNDGSHLVPSILDIGLTDPLWVQQLDDGNFDLKRGFLRTHAITLIRDNYPDEYKRLFGKGITCIVVSDGTAADYARIHVDQGNQQPLTHKFEIQLSANMLFAAGLTERQVAVHLAGLLDRISPLKAEVLEDLAKARESQGEDAYQQRYAEARRGIVQSLKQLWQSPSRVLDAQRYAATMKLPEWAESARQVPILTTKQITALAKAHNEDLLVLDEDTKLPKYDQENPGPSFLNLWAEYVTKTIESKDKDKTRSKALAATKIEDQSKTFVSNGFRALCNQHVGKAYGGDLHDMDRLVSVAECLQKHDPEFWSTCVSRAKEIRDKIVADGNQQLAEFTQKQADEAAEASQKPAKAKAK
jgi:hypothetical protein